MRNDHRTAYWLLLPWVVGVCILTAIPLLSSLVLSLTNARGNLAVDEWAWVGTDNYRRALGMGDRHAQRASHTPGSTVMVRNGSQELAISHPDDTDRRTPTDPKFRLALANSLTFTALAVPLSVCAALAVALLLHRPMRGGRFFRLVIYLPHLLGGVATIVIWSWLFNPQFGWINEGIRTLYALADPLVGVFLPGGTRGWPVPRWLYSPSGCKPALIIMHTWTMGGSMLIFLAARQRISARLYEAATLDGAGGMQRFRSITWPHLTPVVLFNLVLGTVFAMQTFNESYMLQNRQQGGGLLFYALHMYQTAFEPPYDFGYASALGLVFLVVLVTIVGLLLVSARSWVHYDGVHPQC